MKSKYVKAMRKVKPRHINYDQACELLEERNGEIETLRFDPRTHKLKFFSYLAKDVKEKLKTHESTIKISNALRNLGHGIYIEDRVGGLFIETNKKLLDEKYPRGEPGQ